MKAGEFGQKPHGREIANLGGAFQGKMLTKTMMEEQLEMIIRTHEVVQLEDVLQEKMQIKITTDMNLGGAFQEKMQTETAVILHKEMIDLGQEMTVKVMVMILLLSKERLCHQETDDKLSPQDQVPLNSQYQLPACRWQRSLQE